MNFKYLEGNYLFKDINFEIKRGEKIGIVGTTGSGKTTLVNLLIGLLKPSKGEIYIDNKNINENVSNWQNNIGYAPQETFLADETLLFNIVFQSLDENIDKERCKYLIKLMDLEKLVETKNEGLEFLVGEKGIKLSGGQVQRIGIARALYKKPEILILDEATNALDEYTQNKIINNIYKDMKEKTVISISHDFKALKYCDKVFSISKNKFIQL
jgi:ABC-type bacteriocin/lantibiotic exporter with double-glycine peptidase domain